MDSGGGGGGVRDVSGHSVGNDSDGGRVVGGIGGIGDGVSVGIYGICVDDGVGSVVVIVLLMIMMVVVSVVVVSVVV